MAINLIVRDHLENEVLSAKMADRKPSPEILLYNMPATLSLLAYSGNVSISNARSTRLDFYFSDCPPCSVPFPDFSTAASTPPSQLEFLCQFLPSHSRNKTVDANVTHIDMTLLTCCIAEECSGTQHDAQEGPECDVTGSDDGAEEGSKPGDECSRGGTFDSISLRRQQGHSRIRLTPDVRGGNKTTTTRKVRPGSPPDDPIIYKGWTTLHGALLLAYVAVVDDQPSVYQCHVSSETDTCSKSIRVPPAPTGPCSAGAAHSHTEGDGQGHELEIGLAVAFVVFATFVGGVLAFWYRQRKGRRQTSRHVPERAAESPEENREEANRFIQQT